MTLHVGDCLDILPGVADASVDAIVTDPPYSLAFMGREWDTFTPAEFQAWCEKWAAECLRVLRPGGHLLAFGGTRTYHRLASAIEDAGFEIRDSLHWMYGSGFPKSLDVGKAIDKAGPQERRIRYPDFGRYYAARRRESGLSHAEVCAAIGAHGETNHGGASSNWENGLTLPTVAQWDALRSLLGIAGDRSHWPMSVRAEYERQIVGSKNVHRGVAFTSDGPAELPVTVPATEAAARWSGWGTALKPAHEPVIWAQKPAGQAAILAEIGSHLDRLESEWQVLATDPPTRTGRAAGSSAQTDTSPSASAMDTSWNIVSSWRNCWAELCGPMSTSTTAMASSTTTGLGILLSCLAGITVTSILASTSPADGSPSPVMAADSLFAAAVLSMRATLALSVTGSATSGTPQNYPDGGASAAHEPIVLARKPLAAGTVAANVLAWGTGAVNVDACRVTHVSEVDRKRNDVAEPGMRESRSMFGGGFRASTDPAGRWPPNVLLTHSIDCDGQCAEGCPVAGLDAQSGVLKSGDVAGSTRHTVGGNGVTHGAMSGVIGKSFADTGGASRFFPQLNWSAEHDLPFMYQAKASRKERPTAEGISAHPTVKPVALMRWLVRLVTLPGGLVLDPFAGSGTTGEACILEGFRYLLIEKDPASAELIRRRLAKPLQPGLVLGQ